jgi:hypothetical protein
VIGGNSLDQSAIAHQLPAGSTLFTPVFSPDGFTLASTTADGRLLTWQPAEQPQLAFNGEKSAAPRKGSGVVSMVPGFLVEPPSPSGLLEWGDRALLPIECITYQLANASRKA